VPAWQGVFSTQELFLNHLRASGFLLYREIDALSDAAILALWQVEKKKKLGRRRAAPPRS
jgi:hypothetical protein